MKNIVQSKLVLSTSVLALCAMPAYAQSSPGKAPSAGPPNTTSTPADPTAYGQASRGSGQIFSTDDIVVTGTSNQQKKFSAPYSISTIDQAKIQERAPTSVADLLKSSPGLTVEASGGEGGGENVIIRGLPWSGWRLIDFQQDGMPLYESNTERFMNIDEAFRVDLDTQRAEIVRGGTAPLYSNNASGGVVNFITGHGTENWRGAAKVETGTGNRIRGDVAISGPLSENLLVTASGFYRQDDGLRYPGFKHADRGGQVKLGFTYKLPGGKIWGDVKFLNDRAIFYTAVPLTDPRAGPTFGASLSGLIDPTSGTLDTGAFRNTNIRTLIDGAPATVATDLRDGIHPRITTATLGANYDLGSGFRLTSTYRHTQGSIGFTGIFNGASPSDAAAYLASRIGQAKTVFGPSVASLRYVVAGTNTAYNPAETAGLVMVNNLNRIDTRIRYDAADIRLGKSLETPIGRHDLTAGIYYSDYRYNQVQRNNAILQNVRNNPLALDVQALDAAGNVVGGVTESGFVGYGSGSQNGGLTGKSFAFYGADTWHLTDKWSIDAGLRRVGRKQDGTQGVLGTVTGVTTGPIPQRTVRGVVSTIARSENLNGTSWTVGTGYDASTHLNFFTRYSRSFSYPRFDTILGGATLPGTTTPLPVANVQQAEVGVKFAVPRFQIFAVGFWSKFDKLNGGTQVADANGNITNSNIIFNTRTTGLEVEAVWSPLPGFDLSATGMIQNPKLVSITTLTGTSAVSQIGGEITRTPRVQFTFEPSYKFDVGGAKARVYANVYTVGRRFQDFSNLSRLPAYTTLDLGASLALDGIEVRGVMSNVTNEVGLTEGNARAAVIGTGGVGDATVGRSIFGRNFTLSLTKRW